MKIDFQPQTPKCRSPRTSPFCHLDPLKRDYSANFTLRGKGSNANYSLSVTPCAFACRGKGPSGHPSSTSEPTQGRA